MVIVVTLIEILNFDHLGFEAGGVSKNVLACSVTLGAPKSGTSVGWAPLDGCVPIAVRINLFVSLELVTPHCKNRYGRYYVRAPALQRTTH